MGSVTHKDTFIHTNAEHIHRVFLLCVYFLNNFQHLFCINKNRKFEIGSLMSTEGIPLRTWSCGPVPQCRH